MRHYTDSGDAPTWDRSHKFNDLVGSDKAGFELKDSNGQTVMKFYMDYITDSNTQETAGEYAAYSGYRSLGVTGGDGKMLTGDASKLYNFDSTLELNLNRVGYTNKTVVSPVGDSNWDVVNGYSFTVKADAFGEAGFGSAIIFDQHNSPSKLGVNSFVPTATGGEVTNAAIVTARLAGNTVVAVADATVVVGPVGSESGGDAKFFVVDIGSDDVFKYSSAGSSVGDFVLQSGNNEPRDIAANADGSLLWVLDKDKNVNVYQADGSALGFWKADGMGKEPEGLTLDGSDLWLAARDRKIYWYDNAAANTSGTDGVDNMFTPSMSGNLKGIVTDGTYLWSVTEGGTDYVYRFTISRDGAGNPTGLTQSGKWTLPSSNSKPTGITLDPTGASQSLWIVDESKDTVYEYGGGRGLTSGTGVVTNSFKLAATNLAPQGIADPLTYGNITLAASPNDSFAIDVKGDGFVRRDTGVTNFGLFTRIRSGLAMFRFKSSGGVFDSALPETTVRQAVAERKNSDLGILRKQKASTRVPADLSASRIAQLSLKSLAEDSPQFEGIDRLFADWAADPLAMLTIFGR